MINVDGQCVNVDGQFWWSMLMVYVDGRWLMVNSRWSMVGGHCWWGKCDRNWNQWSQCWCLRVDGNVNGQCQGWESILMILVNIDADDQCQHGSINNNVDGQSWRWWMDNVDVWWAMLMDNVNDQWNGRCWWLMLMVNVIVNVDGWCNCQCDCQCWWLMSRVDVNGQCDGWCWCSMWW